MKQTHIGCLRMRTRNPTVTTLSFMTLIALRSLILKSQIFGYANMARMMNAIAILQNGMKVVFSKTTMMENRKFVKDFGIC